MFAHQVIDTLLEYRGRTLRADIVDPLVRDIQRAQHFHFGDVSGIMRAFKGEPHSEKLFFQTDWLKDAIPPYKLTWFDFTAKYFPGESKKGYLINYFEDTKLLIIWSFVYSRDVRTWVAPLAALGVYLERDEWFTYAPSSLYILPFAEADEVTWARDGTLALFGLVLLNCKNIGTVEIPPSGRLNAKRKQRGRQPLFTYKVLVLKPVGRRQRAIPKHLWDNRLHFARGHFKRFTEDGRLFGRFVGRYWWQPQMRGGKRAGFVAKDYLVKTEEINIDDDPPGKEG